MRVQALEHTEKLFHLARLQAQTVVCHGQLYLPLLQAGCYPYP